MGHVARIVTIRCENNILFGKPDGRSFTGPRSRQEYHIKMDVTGTGWKDVNWIKLAEDRDRWRALSTR